MRPKVTGLRFRPRCLLAAWLLTILCWLSPTAAAAGAPVAQYLARRAEVMLSVADAERTANALEDLARMFHGRFTGDGVQIFDLPGEQRRVEATLELPPEALDTALARLRGMSLLVLSEQVEHRDLSRQVAELDRRLEGLRATRRRLRDLEEQAQTESERLRVAAAISETETEIAAAEAALTALRQQVDWAVINILAHEAPPTPTPYPSPAPSRTPAATPIPVTPAPTPWRPGNTVRQATGVLIFLVRALTDLTIAVTIVGGPFLVLAVLGWWIKGRVGR